MKHSTVLLLNVFLWLLNCVINLCSCGHSKHLKRLHSTRQASRKRTDVLPEACPNSYHKVFFSSISSRPFSVVCQRCSSEELILTACIKSRQETSPQKTLPSFTECILFSKYSAMYMKSSSRPLNNKHSVFELDVRNASFSFIFHLSQIKSHH